MRLPDSDRQNHVGKLEGRARLSAGQDVVRGFDNPIRKDSHLVVLYGNLAPTGAVAKISGKEGLRFTGRAIVFESRRKRSGRSLTAR